MVAGVLAEELGAVAELALQSFAKQRIKWFVLTTAHVDTTDRKRNYQLQPLQVVVSPPGLSQELGSEGPQVADALDGGARLEDFDW